MAKSPATPPATQYPGRVFQAVVCAIMLLAMLLPVQGASPPVALARRTLVYTTSASGVSSALCTIVLHKTGKTRELGHLCVPLGLALGTATASWLLARELLLSA